MASNHIDLQTNNNDEKPRKRISTRVAMEVTECDGFERTKEHLIALLTLRAKNSVLRVAKASVYKLETTLMELTTAQALILAMFDALLAEDVHTCSLLLALAATVEQLRSAYLEVWLREDFHFEKEDVRKVLVALDTMELNIPATVARIFTGLTEKYGSFKTPTVNWPWKCDVKADGKLEIESFFESVPELEVPTYELPVAKRCLGLPPSSNFLEVRIQACKTDVDGYTLLHRFAEAGHTQGVEELLSIGVPCDLRGPGGALPIHYAAEYGQIQVLPLLLSAGGNITAPREDGNTAAHLAASMGNVETLRWLADNGANITAKNCKGQTPLHVAAAAGHPAALNSLMELMAEQRRREGTRLGAIPRGLGAVDPEDSEGCTPLHLAARANNVDAVQTLLDKGADYNFINNEGLSPLNEAMLWGANDAEQLLLEIRAFDRKNRK
ncbi:unnamed protein product [Nezara viridula]|uniref:Uncharacterized protein n=1 Tax=Nezara viridula TaxID=85310 RepID=A0A9P0MTY9_NEZVI|nr:unnamed protein product [Nezara viridula]